VPARTRADEKCKGAEHTFRIHVLKCRYCVNEGDNLRSIAHRFSAHWSFLWSLNLEARFLSPPPPPPSLALSLARARDLSTLSRALPLSFSLSLALSRSLSLSLACTLAHSLSLSCLASTVLTLARAACVMPVHKGREGGADTCIFRLSRSLSLSLCACL
jgi:DNA-binding helix-hairpin-helix protein with protein kinase domain